MGASSASSSPRVVLASLVLLTTVTAVVQSLGAPLVPMIATTYGVTETAAQWTLTATLIMGAVSTPLLGRLAGGRHQKQVILTGIAVVSIGCVLSALPLDFWALLTGRLLQGVGIGLTPLAIAAARDAMPAERAPGAIALLSVSTVAGAGLGYPISGFVASYFGLAADFWVGAVLAAIAFVLVYRFVPDPRRDEKIRLDWVGAPLLGLGTVAALLALSQGKSWGWGSPEVLALGLGGVAVWAGWVLWTLRATHPLVDLREAFAPGAIGANLSAVLVGVGMYILLTVCILVVQAPEGAGRGLGHSAAVAGLLLLPYSMMSFMGSRFLPRIRAVVGSDAVLPIGALVFATSLVGLMFFRDEVWQLLVLMAIGGLGSGISFAAMPGLLVRVVSPSGTSSALAFNHVLRYLGFSLGSALALVAIDHHRVDGHATATGFTTASAVGAGFCLVAAAVSAVLTRSRSRTATLVEAAV